MTIKEIKEGDKVLLTKDLGETVPKWKVTVKIKQDMSEEDKEVFKEQYRSFKARDDVKVNILESLT